MVLGKLPHFPSLLLCTEKTIGPRHLTNIALESWGIEENFRWHSIDMGINMFIFGENIIL